MDPQTTQCELSFTNAMEKFDTGDRNSSSREPLETRHWANAQFHATANLFYRIVQIFRRAKPCVLPDAVLGRCFSYADVMPRNRQASRYLKRNLGSSVLFARRAWRRPHPVLDCAGNRRYFHHHQLRDTDTPICPEPSRRSRRFPMINPLYGESGSGASQTLARFVVRSALSLRVPWSDRALPSFRPDHETTTCILSAIERKE